MKLLIDTDPGTDDALALLMALNAPDVKIVGITTVGGNATLAQTTRNALKVLEYMGRADIPVASGAARPLRGRFHYAYDFHGRGGLGIQLPRPTTPPAPEDAATFMAHTIQVHPREITLVALGPLTNVARLLRHHPDAARSLRRLVVMGGALWGPGNVTPHAEFNVYNDPLAAAVVLESGLPLTLVPLDACRRAAVGRDYLPQLRGPGPAARLAYRILRHWFAQRTAHVCYDLCDPLAMAVALNPTVMEVQQGAVHVETQDPATVGRTTFREGAGMVMVPTEVNVAKFLDYFYSLLEPRTVG